MLHRLKMRCGQLVHSAKRHLTTRAVQIAQLWRATVRVREAFDLAMRGHCMRRCSQSMIVST